jgi:hypothetical protein
MKTFRLFFCRCLLISVSLGFAGCATTSTTSKENQSTDWSEFAKQWDDMTPIEKAEDVVWWPIQYGLFFGGYALGSH